MQANIVTMIGLAAALGLAGCAGDSHQGSREQDRVQDCETASDCDPDQIRDQDRDALQDHDPDQDRDQDRDQDQDDSPDQDRDRDGPGDGQGGGRG